MYTGIRIQHKELTMGNSAEFTGITSTERARHTMTAQCMPDLVRRMLRDRLNTASKTKKATA